MNPLRCALAALQDALTGWARNAPPPDIGAG